MTARVTTQLYAVIVMIALSSNAFADDFLQKVAVRERADHETAVSRYQQAARNGSARAQTTLSARYYKGEGGVSRDYEKAVYWSRKAAEQGHADAQTMLGIMYGQGKGVPQDQKQAADWFRKAAEQGHATAQYSLGIQYFMGEGVPKDCVQAWMWSSLAASQSIDSARTVLNACEKRMTPEQIAEAQRLSREWKPR